MSNTLGTPTTGIARKVIDLLGAGVSPVQVALACGITESYVSQLLSQQEIADEVTSLRAARAAQYVEHDDNLDSDEEKARRLVRRNLDNGILKPMEALQHFRVLNAARRQSQAAVATPAVSTVVTLNLPVAAQVQFKLTTDKQIIEVDGRSLATMPASSMARMLKERQTRETLTDLHAMVTDVTPRKMEITTPSLLDSI